MMGNPKISRVNVLAAFAMLLLAVNVSFPAYQLSDIGTLFGDSGAVRCDNLGTPAAVTAATWKWTVLAWLALTIGIFFNAGLYALSGTLGTPKYMQFLKGGFWGIVETAAILTVFTASMWWLYEIGFKTIDTARSYSTVIRNTVLFDFTLMMAGSTAVSFISRQSPTIRKTAFRAFPISFQFAPMFRPLFDGMGTMVQMLAACLAEWVAHEFIFCFIKTTLFSTILPIGIFLRAFGLKGAGNALIGISLSLFFIYPALMVQVGEMLNNYFTRTNEARGWDPTINLFPLCAGNQPICCAAGSSTVVPANESEPFILNGPDAVNPAVPLGTRLGQRVMQQPILDGDFILSMGWGPLPYVSSGAFCTYNTGIARSYGKLFQGLGVLGFATLPVGAGLIAMANVLFLKWMNLSWVALSLYPLMGAFVLNSMYDLVFFVFIVSIVLPIILIFITITAAREIAKILGTEIDLSALEKLI